MEIFVQAPVFETPLEISKCWMDLEQPGIEEGWNGMGFNPKPKAFHDSPLGYLTGIFAEKVP